MSQLNDLSRSLTSLEQDNTIIAVIEMSQSSWLVAGIVPGIERHPLKKLEPNEAELLRLLMRWRAEATKMGCTITRIAVAYEAGHGPAISKPTSSTRRAWLYRASIAARKQIDSTLGCSNASSSAGCVVNQITATWQRFQRLRRRMRSAQTVSARGSDVTQSAGTSRNAADAGGGSSPAKHASRTSSRHGATALCHGPDQGS